MTSKRESSNPPNRSAHVIPALVAGIQIAARCGTCRWMDPGDKPRDDSAVVTRSCEAYCAAPTDPLRAQPLRGAQARGARPPGWQRARAPHEITAFRVDAGHAPCSRLRTQKLSRVKLQRVGVVGVHMRHDVRLGPNEGVSSLQRQQKIGGIQVDNAPKTPDEMRPLRLQGVKGEIGKVGVSLRRRVSGKEPCTRSGALSGPYVIDQGDARARHWVLGVARPIHKQSRPRVALEVLRVKRQPRDKEDGRAIGLGCGEDE